MRWRSGKVLVTGGAGFIGSCLVDKLCMENANVVILDDFSTGRLENISSKDCEIVRGDVGKIADCPRLRDVEYVFHLAAPSSVILFNKHADACIFSTIYGFRSVLEFARAKNVKKLIYASSGSVYGNTQLPQSEGTFPRPTNLYGICKLVTEHIARLYHHDVPNVGLRIFAGYGPREFHKGEFASVVTLFLKSIVKDKRPIVYGDGTQSRDFVYIDDVVEALIRAAENRVTGIVNVGSGSTYTFNQVIRTINSLLNKSVSPINISTPSNYLTRTLADTKTMKEALGVNPLKLEEGLKRYLNECSNDFSPDLDHVKMFLRSE